MAKLRILNLEPDRYSPDARAVLETLGDVVDGSLTRAQLLECLPEFDVLIVRLAHRVDETVIQHAPRLKVIVSATTGLDHIDLQAAHQRGITVLSLRGETDFLRSIPATAELTWGLLLALVRRIPAACNSVVSGAWDRDAFRGHDLAGKRLAILGLGRIGEIVARYGLAFGMRVIAYDPYRQGWIDGVEPCVNLEQLLMNAQVLSVHVPLNEETQGLIGSRELAQLPENALLVNTARGELLDETALLEALEHGRLAGAALDVIHAERGQRSPALLDYARLHDTLLITPHIGGATAESMAATEIFIAKKLRKFLDS
jgi:D-3-phosphoglycerate dehydrogenase